MPNLNSNLQIADLVSALPSLFAPSAAEGQSAIASGTLKVIRPGK